MVIPNGGEPPDESVSDCTTRHARAPLTGTIVLPDQPEAHAQRAAAAWKRARQYSARHRAESYVANYRTLLAQQPAAAEVLACAS